MNGIGFKNMKVFKEDQWFDFKNITLLTGTNNSGKSSIINAMQMLQENIKARNIDDLLKTEFKLTSNQNKYGSIATFVNNEANPEDNYFVFVRQIKNIEYTVKVEINTELESYGSVKQIEALDIKSKVEIFNLIVDNPYPDYQCTFNINYKYFIDRFNRKCENTERLRHWIVELDQLREEVNKGKKTVEEFTEFADYVSKEVSVYIQAGQWKTMGEDLIPANSFSYSIQNDDIHGLCENQSIDEIGVFFTHAKFEHMGAIYDNLFTGFISEDDYIRLFQPSFNNGLFDFSQLWESKPEIKKDFKNIISEFYKKNYRQSYKLLCDDYITYLTNSRWKMKENYSSDLYSVPHNLTKAYIDSFPDFGLIGSMLKFPINDTSVHSGSSYIYDTYVIATQEKYNNEPIKLLENSGFFKEVHSKLATMFLECLKANKINHKELISQPVFNEIYSDISQKIVAISLDFNNVYVSSNRFTSKRAYNFNDNTDFTNLLKQVEDLNKNVKKKCTIFIDKWLKEFGIADKLLLKPDSDTGNFKAFLRIGDKETQLADFGLGTNQLLPIIFSLGIHYYKTTPIGDELIPRTVVIEEPEANLHPALQSKLADMFVEATNKFNVQIIAETHSEYLIRRMQYLVAKDFFQEGKNEISISNDKVNIYYVNSEIDELGRKAYEINITKNGQLTESFGKGFFDETTTLQFELYKLNNSQSN